MSNAPMRKRPFIAAAGDLLLPALGNVLVEGARSLGYGAQPPPMVRRAFFTPGQYGRRRNFRRVRTTTQRLRGYWRRGGYYGRFNRRTGYMPEFKFLDFTTGPTAVNTALNNTLNDYMDLSFISQGVGENQRIGRKCTLRYLEIRGILRLPSTTTVANASDTVRMIVYIDKQTNGAHGTKDLILKDLVGGDPTNAPLNLEHQFRYSIISDKRFKIEPKSGGINTATNGATAWVTHPFSFITMLNCPLLYGGSTGVLAELCCNSLHIMFVSFNGTTTVEFTGRVRFSDA